MILILNCGSSKTLYIEELVDEFSDFKTIPILDFTLADLTGKTGVIISGAPILVTEQEIGHFLKQVEFIKTTTIPILGICFGHQLVGITFGAFASRMREDRDWQTIGLLDPSPLFDKLPDEFEMMEDHCEAISIPPNFNLIAASDACVNEGMQHKELLVFGVQFHPEVSGNYGRTIFENFIRLCEEKVSH
jgi:GMP synthase (glutamine-hydrolysing)